MTFDEDSKGNIWIGTFSSGLYSYHQTSEKFTHHKSKNFLKHNIHKSNIRKVLVDKNDAVWIGSREGVYKVEITNSNTFNVSSLNNKMNSDLESSNNYSIKSNIIYSLFEDSNRNIWIGTLGNGLSKYNPKNNTFKRYNSNNGLIHETIFSIIEDKDKSIWIGGNKGLSALNTQTNTFTNFNKTDGLLSNTFNYNAVLKDENNVLFFGNSKGINYFNPSEIVYNKEKPIVYIRDLKLSNDIVNIEDKNSPLKKIISKTILSDKNITIVEGEATSLMVKNNSVCGVVLRNEEKIFSNSVVITCGTFLSGVIHIGDRKILAGRMGESASIGMTEYLRSVGFRTMRLKTGTPPRVLKSSVNWNNTTEDYGDKNPTPFSYFTSDFDPKNEPCHTVRTSEKTHKIIDKNGSDLQIDDLIPVCEGLELDLDLDTETTESTTPYFKEITILDVKKYLLLNKSHYYFIERMTRKQIKEDFTKRGLMTFDFETRENDSWWKG